MVIHSWNMQYQQHQELAATAPCSMYSVLLEHGLIQDPFYGLNEQELTDLSREDCVFSSVFEIQPEEWKKDYIELVFHGLDTICDIYFNGTLLSSVMNMHRTYRFDVKKLARCGKNEIKLVFHSPIQYFEEQNRTHFLWTNGDLSGDTIKGAAHLRKCLSMSGWDWGPKLPDMGIFRKVELLTYDCDRWEDVFIRQCHKNGAVTLTVSGEAAHRSDGIEMEVEFDGKRYPMPGGKAVIEVDQPALWWPRGYGEQPLYSVTFLLKKEGRILDRVEKRIGLRTLTLSAGAANNHEFAFVVNGIKIFSMGANYIPQDSILSRIHPERTKKLLEACVDANYNTIRVWGGGYYPEDEFFDLCDELGLIVWQDFMFACVNIWLTEEFEKNVRAEFEDNLKRIRHHASLGLLCGNNEIELDLKSGRMGRSVKVKADYLRLYEGILPDLCARFAPQTFYWPSSPSAGGGFEDTNALDKGDTHYWDVWHGGTPFTAYREHRFRFCSEYGFESFPSMKTIRSFCGEEDLNAFSQVMENHQKCKSGNAKILTYLAEQYLYPTSFQALVYASQLLQADAIKYGVEYFRKIRGYCMGSLYWQVNDCWPVASWSSIDYFGRYKALHYAAKKFYAPVAMGLFEEGGRVCVNIANETREEFCGTVKLFLCNRDFTVFQAAEQSVSIAPLSSADAAEMICKEAPAFSYFYADLFDREGHFLMRQTLLFVPPKRFAWEQPALQAQIIKEGDFAKIHVTSNTFAKSVEVDFTSCDLVLSDNYFDITSPEGYTVQGKTNLTAEELSAAITLQSVYDIR